MTPYSGDEQHALPLMVGDVIVHSDVLTHCFACDIASCQGACCHEGDAGAPVTPDEIGSIEDELDAVWPHMTASAQAVVDRQGVAYLDPEGELVTSIVGVGDCVFRGPRGCLLRRRPMSCWLYPIREKKIGPYVGLDYHRWDICRAAVAKGEQEGVRVFEFLREPLIARFGQEWYDE